MSMVKSEFGIYNTEYGYEIGVTIVPITRAARVFSLSDLSSSITLCRIWIIENRGTIEPKLGY